MHMKQSKREIILNINAHYNKFFQNTAHSKYVKSLNRYNNNDF